MLDERSSSVAAPAERNDVGSNNVDGRPAASIAERMRSLQDAGMIVNVPKRLSKEIQPSYSPTLKAVNNTDPEPLSLPSLQQLHSDSTQSKPLPTHKGNAIASTTPTNPTFIHPEYLDSTLFHGMSIC